jgi:hypothetical protein
VSYVKSNRQYTHILSKYKICLYELQKQAEKSLFFPVSRKVQINFIFPDIYCVYTTTSCMQNITKRKKKTLDICIKFPMGCLHRSPNLTCLLCITLHKTQDASRDINQRFIHHLYIDRKCTDCECISCLYKGDV